MSDLRVLVDRSLAPVARRLTISPNLLTLLALLAMLAAGGLVLHQETRWAGVLILVSGLFDLFDGAVARAQARATTFGALLDRVADRAGDIAILASFILSGGISPALGLYTLSTVVIASYTSACLEAATASNIGQKISLRGVRIGILALMCLTAALTPGMLLLASIGTYALITRLVCAYRLLR